MVGISSKLRGCDVCRKRKIKCDQRKPSCGQCSKAKRICGGYERPAVFLNNFVHTYSEKSCQISKDRSDQVNKENETADVVFNSSFPATRAQRPSFVDIAPCSHLERHQLLANFVDSTLPRQRSVPLSWIIDVVKAPGDATALSYAGAAIGIGWIGHFDMLSPAIKRGRRSYLLSLASLREALSKKGEISPKEQLTTMALLLLYEMIEFGTDDASGWIAHTNGIEATLARATPQTFVAATNHKLFLFCRAVIILKSLTIRRKNILSQDEWLHGPWMLYPKTAFHKLLDLAAETACVLEDFDNVMNANHRSLPHLQKAAASIALLLLRLKQWEKLHGCILPDGPPKAFSGPLLIPEVSQSTDKSLDRHWYPGKYPDRSDVQFLLLQQVRLMLPFWALVVSLHTCILEMQAFPLVVPTSVSTDPGSEVTKEFYQDIRMAMTTHDAAVSSERIGVWFNFAVQDAWQSFGPVFGIFSLKAAILWYQVYQKRRLPDLELDRAEELEKCQRLLREFIIYGSPRTKGR